MVAAVIADRLERDEPTLPGGRLCDRRLQTLLDRCAAERVALPPWAAASSSPNPDRPHSRDRTPRNPARRGPQPCERTWCMTRSRWSGSSASREPGSCTVMVEDVGPGTERALETVRRPRLCRRLSDAAMPRYYAGLAAQRRLRSTVTVFVGDQKQAVLLVIIYGYFASRRRGPAKPTASTPPPPRPGFDMALHARAARALRTGTSARGRMFWSKSMFEHPRHRRPREDAAELWRGERAGPPRRRRPLHDLARRPFTRPARPASTACSACAGAGGRMAVWMRARVRAVSGQAMAEPHLIGIAVDVTELIRRPRTSRPPTSASATLSRPSPRPSFSGTPTIAW